MRTLAWNVDTQVDFVRPDGRLPVPGASMIEEVLGRLTRLFAATATRVVNTADWHHPGSAELSNVPDFVSTFPPHCMAGTPGAEFVPATRPEAPCVVGWDETRLDPAAILAARNVVIRKDAFDVFRGNPHTDAVLELLQPDRAIVYGVATDVCVDHAVRGLLGRGLEVVVVTDAVKDLEIRPFETVVAGWRTADGRAARLVSADAVEDLLR